MAARKEVSDSPRKKPGAARWAPAPAARPAGAQRVLAAALDLFGQSGYEGTSLQQIADRLGVTKAAVYYHFRTKNEILGALLQPALMDLQYLLDLAERGSFRSGDGREQNLSDFVDFLLRHQQVTAFVTRDLAAAGQPELREPLRMLGDRLRALVLGDLSPAPDRLAVLWANATLGALSGAALTLDMDEAGLREQLVELGRHMSAGYRKAQRRAAQETSLG